MKATHSTPLVLLSVVIALVSAYTALVLTARVAAAGGRTRRRWLLGGGVAMGVGIWSMHFVAMLALRLPVPVAHDVSDVFFSLVVAVGASLLALHTASRPELQRGHLAGAALAMGAGITGMHYIGMAGLVTTAHVHYNAGRVALSFAAAVGASLAALWLAFHHRDSGDRLGAWPRALSTAGLGGAIAGMHYIGISAVRFTPLASAPAAERDLVLGTSGLTGLVVVAAAAILVLALVAARIDRRARSHSAVILERITDGFLAFDPAGECTYANRAAELLLRRPRQAMLGGRLHDFLPGAADSALERACRRAMAEQATVEVEEFQPALALWLEVHVYPSANGLSVYFRDVTARRTADEALRRREQQLAEAQRIAHVGSWEWDVRTGEVSWSEETYRIFGLEPRGVVPSFEGFLGCIHPDDRESMSAAIGRAMETGSSFALEKRILCPGGELRFVHCQGGVVVDDAGTPLRFTGTCQDVTERKEAEHRLREASHMVDAVVHASPLAVIAVDTSRRVTLWNPAAERTFGWSRDEVLGEVNPIVPPGQPGLLHQMMERPGAAAGITLVDAQRLRRDGSQVDVSVSAAPLYDPEGEMIGGVVIIADITARKQTEAALRASELKFRSVTQSAADGIVTINAENRIVSWNRGAETVFGYTEAEALDQPLDMVMPERFREQHRRGVECMAQTGQASLQGTVLELVGLRRDGTEFPLELSLALWEAGGRRFATGIMRDITERRQAEEALRKSQEQLAQAQKMEAVGRLAGGVAHDFNNLLTVINGNASLALMDREADEELCDHLAEIMAASERAANLTRQLLAFSRQQVLQPRQLDLDVVVSGMHKMLSRLIAEDVDVVLKLHGALPQVKADPTQVEQVILNLAVNARDAMPDGGQMVIRTRVLELDHPEPHAGFELPAGSYVVLTVSDTGCGMDSDTLRRVFEPFFTTKEEGRGTGLGLATVYGIVKQSGGFIKVDSEPGRGTRFEIFLPSLPAQAPSGSRAAEGLPNPPAMGSGVVLLVEDDAAVRLVGSRALKRSGYTVLTADDGEHGLQVATAYPSFIDLVVTDVVMPRMGGRELARRLLHTHPGARVLFTSGFTEDAVLRTATFEAGAHFLPKPFGPAELVQRVAEVLESSWGGS